MTDRAVKAKATDSALCEGLEVPIDELATTLLDYSQTTPPQVISKATTVVRGYDAGCP